MPKASQDEIGNADHISLTPTPGGNVAAEGYFAGVVRVFSREIFRNSTHMLDLDIDLVGRNVATQQGDEKIPISNRQMNLYGHGHFTQVSSLDTDYMFRIT
ncbi:hypothetical protein GCM10010837_37950 [Aminobacter niigataensis]